MVRSLQKAGLLNESFDDIYDNIHEIRQNTKKY